MRSLPLSRLSLCLALAAPAAAQLRIACLGDSITFGARIADREHSCYPAQLAALRPRDEVRNFGVGGATLLLRADRPLASTRAFRDAVAWRPDVAVVMLGTNDSCDTERRPNWAHQGDLERDARALVERLRRANPECRVVLATPPAMFPDQQELDGARRADLQARSPRLRRVAAALQRAAAAPGAEYLELGGVLRQRDVVDGVHPDPFGAERIARRVDERLRWRPHRGEAPLRALRRRLAGDASVWADAAFEGFRGAAFELPGLGVRCRLVSPHTVAAGAPWILRARFFGHRPALDVALLERGFHLAYCDVTDLYGSDEALARWDACYDLLTACGLSQQVVLEGMSRGGLPIVNWAAAHPEQVAAIYGDNPVADFRSWPGGRSGKRSERDWRRCLQAYALDEAAARDYARMPVDRLQPIAAAAVPLLLVLGEDDRVVPPDENGELLAQRYAALGGPVTVWRKPGQGHHPHGLDPVDPLLRAVLRATGRGRSPTVHSTASVEYRRGAGWGEDTWRDQVGRMQALARAHPSARVVLLGDSITQGLTGASARAAVAGGARAFDRAFGDLGALALGLSGDRTEHLLWRIANGALQTLSPDVIVLQIGVNNVNAAGHTATETAAGIHRVVEALREAAPEAHVLVCGPFPAGERKSPVRRTLDDVHAQIESLGERERVTYLDLRSLFLDEQGATNGNMRPDRVHLTPAGMQAWMAAISAPVRELAARAR